MDEEPPSASPAAGATQQQLGGTPAAAKAKRQAGSAVFNEVVIDEVRVWSDAALPASTCYRRFMRLGCMSADGGASHSSLTLPSIGMGSQVGLASSCYCQTPLMSSTSHRVGMIQTTQAFGPAAGGGRAGAAAEHVAGGAQGAAAGAGGARRGGHHRPVHPWYAAHLIVCMLALHTLLWPFELDTCRMAGRSTGPVYVSCCRPMSLRCDRPFHSGCGMVQGCYPLGVQ